MYRQSQPILDLDEYLAFVEQHIREKQQTGCIALKLPIAYDRDLLFSEAPRELAQKALLEGDAADREGVRAFQHYVFFYICRLAAEVDIPIQVHTGMGCLQQTNALSLREVIAKNPATRFVLLHCSYPWVEETNALMHLYPNVYPDLSWLPMLSISVACHVLHSLIEGGGLEKVCWGCDTWTPEESYGALLVFRLVLAQVMTEKIQQGYFSFDDACRAIDHICYQNATEIYRLGKEVEEG
jgi:predicted TIM-barrel fold metal-dependent hydrolase